MSGRPLTEREWVLGLTILGISTTALLLRGLVLPAWNRAAELRAEATRLSGEHDRLTNNLAMKPSVDEEFRRLGPHAFQRESDQITLSSWLRELEAPANRPGILLGNMKAQPVKSDRASKVYRIRLSVSGSLQEILQFVSEANNGASYTGLESFSVRGIPGLNMVECVLSLRMVRLLSDAAKSRNAVAPATTFADRMDGVHAGGSSQR